MKEKTNTFKEYLRIINKRQKQKITTQIITES